MATSIYPKHFFQGYRNMSIRRGECFVLMPFDHKFNPVFDTIKDTLQSSELNMRCSRADDISRGGYVMNDILRNIAESEFIIADLTERNPNVFYELGIAHMTKNDDDVILLAQKNEDVPFDLGQFRYIVYEQDQAGYSHLSDTLTTTFQERNKGQLRFVVNDGQTFSIPRRLMGKEGHMYELELYVAGVAYDGAKCELKVYKISRDRSRKLVDDQWKGLDLEHNSSFEYQNYVDCALKLERTDEKPSRATFMFTKINSVSR